MGTPSGEYYGNSWNTVEITLGKYSRNNVGLLWEYSGTVWEQHGNITGTS